MFRYIKHHHAAYVALAGLGMDWAGDRKSSANRWTGAVFSR